MTATRLQAGTLGFPRLVAFEILHIENNPLLSKRASGLAVISLPSVLRDAQQGQHEHDQPGADDADESPLASKMRSESIRSPPNWR